VILIEWRAIRQRLSQLGEHLGRRHNRSRTHRPGTLHPLPVRLRAAAPIGATDACKLRNLVFVVAEEQAGPGHVEQI
jgi:hypothetical protein